MLNLSNNVLSILQINIVVLLFVYLFTIEIFYLFHFIVIFTSIISMDKNKD